MKRFEDVVEFHGHSCPGLAIGYRVALRAVREMGKRSSDEEIVAIAENSSCAIDAIQVLTGCTLGKGNLIFRDYGKQVYSFIARPAGKGIRISVVQRQMPETDNEKTLRLRYAQGARTKKIVNFIESHKAARLKHILDADESDIMVVSRLSMVPPPEASVYQSICCAICHERVAEPMVRVTEGTMVCIPCAERKGVVR